VTVGGVRRNGGVVFNVTAQGDRILMQDGVRQALAGQGDVANLEPKAAPAFLAACVAGNAGGGIGIEDGDGYLTLTATMP
ncbi:MAG: histidine phosphotransferase family protein, partial [Sphingomonadales bacterium]